MSKQLAISATLSILAMAGLALSAPAIADQSGDAPRVASAATVIAAPAILAD